MSAHPETRERGGAGLAAGLAMLLAVLYALPVLRHPRARLWGDGGDAYGTLAGIADIGTWLRGGTRPRLTVVDLQPLIDLPAGLLATAVGPTAAYNLILLAGFPLAAWLGCRVALAAGANRRGAWLAALLFAFSPYHLAHAREHLDQAQVWPAALVALAAVALLRRPRAATAVALVMSGVVAAAVNGYLPFLLLPLAVIAVLAALVGANTTRARTGVIAVIVAALAAGCIAVRSLPGISAELRTRPSRAADDADVVRYSARPAEYLRPSVSHPLRKGPQRLNDHDWHGSTAVEQTLDVGIVPLLLAIVGFSIALRARGVARRVAIVLGLAAVTSLWLSLPPWWGASAWFHAWFPWVRATARFALVVQLVVSLYAGVAASRLPIAGFVAVALACALTYLPARSWHEVEPLEATEWLESHASRVADFPPDRYRYLRRFRPLDGVAMMGRVELAMVGAGDLEDASTPERLAGLGVTHAVVHGHTLWVPPGLDEVQRFASTHIYAVVAPPPPLLASFRHGFAPPEDGGRWLLGGVGVLRLETAEGTREVSANLRFVVHSPIAREVVLESDGLELSRRGVVPGRGHAFAITLAVAAPGRNIVLRAVPPGVRVLAGTGRSDPRSLALHLSDVVVDPRAVTGDDGWTLNLGDGIGAREPSDERWIAGRAELAVASSSIASPAAAGRASLTFAARSLSGRRRVTVAIAADRHEVDVTADAWTAVELAVPPGTSRIVIDGGPARSIRDATGAADDREVSIAVRALRLRAGPL